MSKWCASTFCCVCSIAQPTMPDSMGVSSSQPNLPIIPEMRSLGKRRMIVSSKET